MATVRGFRGSRAVLACLFVPVLTSWSATIRYVWQRSPDPGPPFANWATAAHDIQTAVDAAAVGDEIVVTNGTYASGGRAPAVSPLMTNRVLMDKAVTVRSVNGPSVTVIAGQRAPDAPDALGNGDGAIRCVYVGEDAVLSGFTLTNGHSGWIGSGVDRSQAGGAWCGPSALLTNCVLTGNSASKFGGAVFGGIMIDCTVTGNAALDSGGGVYAATLQNCSLTANSTSWGGGGGASQSTLNNCTLTFNSATYGGGASGSTLNNCALTRNSATYGGGASGGTLNNCTLTSNSARLEGGGVFGGTLGNCTLTGNSAGFGGGASQGTLNNCIVHANTALGSANYLESRFAYSCTTPLPAGPGNIDADPLLASTTHLSAQSPCIGRGSRDYTAGVDVDGEAWLDPPCMGADQFVAGAALGPLTLAITASYTQVATGFAVTFVADNSGAITASAWEFGDGTRVSNRPYVSHAWSNLGLYPVRLTGYNDAHPTGVSVQVLVDVTTREVYYADRSSRSPAYPYRSRSEAAQTIQEAIDAGTQIGRLVLVSAGLYARGGRAVVGTMTNRVAIAEGVEVRSEGGPSVTIIAGQPTPGPSGNLNGEGAIRCVYVGTNAVLSGFTLTNGYTLWGGDSLKARSGGGAWCEPSGILTNCVLTVNAAYFSGGGAFGGTLNDCILKGNAAGCCGGGASRGTLNRCTLTRNYGYEQGGGASESALNRCTASANVAYLRGGGVYRGSADNTTLLGNSASYRGGGSFSAALRNCTLTANSAQEGGGADGGTLFNCTVTGNSASSLAGGTHGGLLYNSIVCFNTAPRSANYAGSAFLYSCTIPSPSGPANLDADPLFVSPASGDFRLRSNSPCIDAGLNEFAFGNTDGAGNPRILGGQVDQGAYEFDPAAHMVFISSFKRTPDVLQMEWPATALGSTLQRSALLNPPDWRDVPGSESATSFTVPVTDSNGYFRLLKK